VSTLSLVAGGVTATQKSWAFRGSRTSPSQGKSEASPTLIHPLPFTTPNVSHLTSRNMNISCYLYTLVLGYLLLGVASIFFAKTPAICKISAALCNTYQLPFARAAIQSRHPIIASHPHPETSSPLTHSSTLVHAPGDPVLSLILLFYPVLFEGSKRISRILSHFTHHFTRTPQGVCDLVVLSLHPLVHIRRLLAVELLKVGQDFVALAFIPLHQHFHTVFNATEV